jgi:hypothetical protein
MQFFHIFTSFLCIIMSLVDDGVDGIINCAVISYQLRIAPLRLPLLIFTTFLSSCVFSTYIALTFT